MTWLTDGWADKQTDGQTNLESIDELYFLSEQQLILEFGMNEMQSVFD